MFPEVGQTFKEKVLEVSGGFVGSYIDSLTVFALFA